MAAISYRLINGTSGFKMFVVLVLNGQNNKLNFHVLWPTAVENTVNIRIVAGFLLQVGSHRDFHVTFILYGP